MQDTSESTLNDDVFSLSIHQFIKTHKKITFMLFLYCVALKVKIGQCFTCESGWGGWSPAYAVL